MGRHLLGLLLVVAALPAARAEDARLDVPLMLQDRSGLCGPVVLAMVLAYWGDDRDPLLVAHELIRLNPNEPRYIGAGFATEPFDLDRYPGTGISVMKGFLESAGPTEIHRVSSLPEDPRTERAVRDEHFEELRRQVAAGVPVVVHQYWARPGSRGHYRVVTGFSDTDWLVYLNDPRTGRIAQSYDYFFALWRIPKARLAYISLVLHPAPM